MTTIFSNTASESGLKAQALKLRLDMELGLDTIILRKSELAETQPTIVLKRLKEEIINASQICSFDIGIQRISLVIPLNQLKLYDYVIYVEVPASEQHFCQRIASCCLEMEVKSSMIDKLEEINTSLIKQVTKDYEEMTLIRSVAKQLNTFVGSRNLESIVETILEEFIQPIRAESIIFLQYSEEDGMLEESTRVGFSTVSESSILAALEFFRSKREKVEIANKVDDVGVFAEIDGIRGFIMVPVKIEDDLVAWLLAINNIVPETDDEWEIINSEFGSVESTLLEIAATIIANSIQSTGIVRERDELLANVVRSLVSTLEAKDSYTCGHSERVATYAQFIAEKVGYSELDLERIFLAGLLHDIGKIGVPDSILNKTTALTEDEFNTIARHPAIGWNIIKDISELSILKDGILHHHERFDGNGYPFGLMENDIPMDARILSIADAFDAMSSDRPYRKGLPAEYSLKKIMEGSGIYWDPELCELFAKHIHEIVDLSSDHVEGQSSGSKAGTF